MYRSARGAIGLCKGTDRIWVANAESLSWEKRLTDLEARTRVSTKKQGTRMNAKNRIQRLEQRLPKVTPGEFRPNFEFRVAGRKRRDCQLELIDRLTAAIADRRASELQRAYWNECVRNIEAALEPSED